MRLSRLGRLLLGLCLTWAWTASAAPEIGAQEATGEVAVTVADQEGNPLEDVRIVVEHGGGEAGGLTDASGRAVVRAAAGEATVRVERIGFASRERRVEVPGGERVTVDLALEDEAFELEEIIVTSTRSDRRIEDVPIRVEVIGREEVEEKLQMTPGDIAMLLNETAGLRVQPTAPSLGGASVRIQGLRGRYTLILSDGLPLYGGQSGALGPLQIPPMDLGQVEVIKGVASALYGATALGGVVNLISRRPRPDERELLLNASSLGGGDAVLWLADDPEGPWGWSLLGGLHGQGKVDQEDDGWADLPAYRRGVARARVQWEDGATRSVRATVGAMMEDREGGTVSGGLTPAGTPFPEELETRRADAGVVARLISSGGTILSLRGSGSFQVHDHLFGGVRERDRQGTAFMEAAVSDTDGAHTWMLGAAFQSDLFRARDVDGFDYTHTVPSLLAQDEVELAPWLVVSASARLDHHNVYGTFLSPRLSGLFRPGEWSVRASVGSGYFAPTPLHDEVQAVGLSRLAPLPDDLEAERGRSASLDVGRSLGPWELNATLFASEVEDPVLALERPGGGLELVNGSEPMRTWGTDLLARYDAEPFFATGTYVYTRATETVEGVRREVPLTPRHTAGVVAAWEDDDWGRVGGEIYFTGRQELEDDPYRDHSKRYVSVGFLVERRFENGMRVFFNAENIFDARQTRWSPLMLPERAPDGRWITDVWAPLDGRAFNGGIIFSF
ncbi:MAG: TonB-dependent receptor [Longimicrobiales bacterium]|nr:TonB-dependent receptor [Longimicrobiales bacterium]